MSLYAYLSNKMASEQFCDVTKLFPIMGPTSPEHQIEARHSFCNDRQRVAFSSTTVRDVTFRGTWCLHLQGEDTFSFFHISLILRPLKMEIAGASESSVSVTRMHGVTSHTSAALPVGTRRNSWDGPVHTQLVSCTERPPGP
jgi:hypothetical protein